MKANGQSVTAKKSSKITAGKNHLPRPSCRALCPGLSRLQHSKIGRDFLLSLDLQPRTKTDGYCGLPQGTRSKEERIRQGLIRKAKCRRVALSTTCLPFWLSDIAGRQRISAHDGILNGTWLQKRRQSALEVDYGRVKG